ncbi:MAG: hypothetical protein COY81_03955, partial [Candidatus Pacebacteria bacterium CG_4_10_14_0_8_um_filter_43_12]
MHRSYVQRLAIFVLVIGLFGLASLVNHRGYVASLTGVSVTLSNPRPSFKGALGSGNTVSSSLVTINTTAGAYPSTSSGQLVQGDTVRIGTGGSLTRYNITEVTPENKLSI